MIDDCVTITIVEIRGDKVRLGIEAPIHTPVHRYEYYDPSSPFYFMRFIQPRSSKSPETAVKQKTADEWVGWEPVHSE